MGGCYSSSYSYRESSCSRQATPAWKTTLKKALQESNREQLTEAYKAYFAELKSGFIAEAAKLLGITDILRIPKEFSDFEYEVKFDVQAHGEGEEPGIVAYLNSFDFPVATHGRFFKDPVNTNAVGVNHFFGTEREERLVVIEKEGTHLKEKSEYLPLDVAVPYREIVSKRKEQRYPASLEEIIQKVGSVNAEAGVAYRGRIRKEKGDIFILDANDGRIYGFTITRAHLIKPGQKDVSEIQRQLEIEYAGYLPGFSHFVKNSEEQIVAGMVDLARYTYGLYGNAPLGNGWRISLSPTMERKYDFVAETAAKKKFENNRAKREKRAFEGVLALPA
jgi:hypothetical protein